MITSASCIANNGLLMKPKIVKEIKNTDTGAITTISSVPVRQVVSKETSATMMDMLETVVTDGTGKYAKVKGYSIAGKTGTSESDPNKDEGTTASFLAISPVENPEVVLLVTLYNPQGPKGSHGDRVAAPVAGQMLSEILPYLQVTSDSFNNTNGNSNQSITLPDVTNRTVAEAKKILEKSGFTASTSATPSELVKEQFPVRGSQLYKNSIIKLYSEKENTRVSKQVPNLIGKTLSQAKNLLKEKNLNINVVGKGEVVSQDPIAETPVEEGSIIKITLSN